jgi:uncharacterized ferredoxin-like protein
MIAKSQEIEQRALEAVADLVCLAARTAPKGRGVDDLVVMTVNAREKDLLAEEMRRIAKEFDAAFFERDANCVDKAPLVILLGQRVPPRGVAPCGYCGFKDCGENAQHNGVCAVSVTDLGIAIGSAASVLAQHHVDNRVMFTIGRAALNLDIFDEDVKVAYGIPLSVSAKSPFFDRG